MLYLKIKPDICCLKVKYQRMKMDGKNKMFLCFFRMIRMSRPEGNDHFYWVGFDFFFWNCSSLTSRSFSVEVGWETQLDLVWESSLCNFHSTTGWEGRRMFSKCPVSVPCLEMWMRWNLLQRMQLMKNKSTCMEAQPSARYLRRRADSASGWLFK